MYNNIINDYKMRKRGIGAREELCCVVNLIKAHNDFFAHFNYEFFLLVQVSLIFKEEEYMWHVRKKKRCVTHIWEENFYAN